MKNALDTSVHELPLTELQCRVQQARVLLREMHAANDGGVERLNRAIDVVERVLPGFMAQPRGLFLRSVCDWSADERRALRRAIDAERIARSRLRHLLGDVSPVLAEEALCRVEAREALLADFGQILRSFERTAALPMLA